MSVFGLNPVARPPFFHNYHCAAGQTCLRGISKCPDEWFVCSLPWLLFCIWVSPLSPLPFPCSCSCFLSLSVCLSVCCCLVIGWLFSFWRVKVKVVVEVSPESFPFNKKRKTSIGKWLKWSSDGLQFIVPLQPAISPPRPAPSLFWAGCHVKVAGHGLVNVNLTFSLMLSCIWKPLCTQFKEDKAPWAMTRVGWLED